jgi:hypothetical protein
MTKKNFLKATQYQRNEVRSFNGLHIRVRLWDANPWQIVNNQDFEKADIIKDFRLREDLWSYIKSLKIDKII